MFYNAFECKHSSRFVSPENVNTWLHQPGGKRKQSTEVLEAGHLKLASLSQDQDIICQVLKKKMMKKDLVPTSGSPCGGRRDTWKQILIQQDSIYSARGCCFFP
ncbi:uncharacterized protein [Manis javanica]|uniref:uncharacterized protein isoform X2 n=1 Tax=Manis javanica TaxID=9974 RepID=UPI003C6D4623